MFRRKPAEFNASVSEFSKSINALGNAVSAGKDTQIEVSLPLTASGSVKLVSPGAYAEFRAILAAEEEAALAPVIDIDSIRDAG